MTIKRHRRIAIYGHAGSGKSWLAGIISARLNLPVVELDALFHVNNWNNTPIDEFRANIERALESSPRGWISAGNYLGGRVADRFPSATTLGLILLAGALSSLVCSPWWSSFHRP